MTGLEATLSIIDVLENLDIPYMLVGSFSSSYYGIPRITEDADFVIAVASDTIGRIAHLLPSNLRLDPQMSFETVTMTIRNIINLDGNAFTIELFHLREDEYDQVRFARRVRHDFHGRATWFPTAEDVVLQKLRWLHRGKRDKDRHDIRDVLFVKSNELDWNYVEKWADAMETRPLLEEVRAIACKP